MKKWIILAIYSLSFNTFSRAPGTYTQVKMELQKISQKNLISTLNDFVKSSYPSRMVGMPGHTKAQIFLQEAVKKLDSKNTGKLTLNSFVPDAHEGKGFYQKDFDEKVEGKIPKTSPEYQKWLKFTAYMQGLVEKYKNEKGMNIIWEKAGLDSKKVLVVTAHYDTISHDPNTLLVRDKDPMPGANYNASGVAVALALIQILSQIDLNYSVQVALLDWQGLGFLGAFQYAKELKSLENSGKNIMGVMNLEMLGQDTSFFDKTKKTGNMCVYTRNDSQEKKWTEELIRHGSKITSKVSFELKANNFENSDNIRFWEQGTQSATFSQNWQEDFNPKFYQTPLDTPETLNHETLYYSYQYLGGAVLGILLDITK